MLVTIRTGTSGPKASWTLVVACPACGTMTQLDYCEGDWIGACYEADKHADGDPHYWFGDV